MSLVILYYYDGDWAGVYRDGRRIDQGHISTMREATLHEHLGVEKREATAEQEEAAMYSGEAPESLEG